MTIFEKELAEVAERAAISTFAQLPSSGNPLQPAEGLPVFLTLRSSGAPKFVILVSGTMEGELGTELRKTFSQGEVSWRGLVEASEIDDASESHIITMQLALDSEKFKIEPLELKIPFSRLPRGQAPKIGAVLAFKGMLLDQEGSLKAIDVAYPVPESGSGKQTIIKVQLSEVTPEK